MIPRAEMTKVRPPMSDEARDLAGRYTDLARRVARQHHRRFALDLDEATSIAMEALCEAATSYIEKREARFAFASYVINGILDTLADNLKYRSRKCRDFGRAVPLENLLGATCGDGGRDEFEAESSRRFEALLSVLPGRDAEVLGAYYRDAHKAHGSGIAGRALGVDPSWAAKIHRRALARLRFLANSPGLLSTKPLIVRETLAR